MYLIDKSETGNIKIVQDKPFMFFIKLVAASLIVAFYIKFLLILPTTTDINLFILVAFFSILAIFLLIFLLQVRNVEIFIPAKTITIKYGLIFPFFTKVFTMTSGYRFLFSYISIKQYFLYEIGRIYRFSIVSELNNKTSKVLENADYDIVKNISYALSQKLNIPLDDLAGEKRIWGVKGIIRERKKDDISPSLRGDDYIDDDIDSK